MVCLTGAPNIVHGISSLVAKENMITPTMILAMDDEMK
jgi:hypothetical protein